MAPGIVLGSCVSRSERAPEIGVSRSMEVACGIMWLVSLSHVNPIRQVTFFSHRVTQCPTQPQTGRYCPARKNECGHSPNCPPQRTKLGLVVRRNPLIGSPLWIAKKLLGIRLLFISPFSYFSKSLFIHFNCTRLLRFSCDISSLGSPCLSFLENLGN